MATQADIDRNNAEYQNAKNAAEYWLAQGNMQAAHDAHKVMQKAAEDNQRIAPTVAAANAEWHKNYQASQSSGPAPAPAPASTPPSPWLTTPTFTQPTGIKQADPDIVLAPATDASGDYIVERFFEELGGTELINLSRYDLIDGINVSYNPIANLSSLRQRFNPNNIIAIDYLSENEFTRTSIDLLSRGINEPYFNNNGDLVIEIDIIRTEENIEAEISQSGTVDRIEL